jgi:hypothetical protein
MTPTPGKVPPGMAILRGLGVTLVEPIKYHYRPLRTEEMVGRACLPAYLGSVSLLFFATVSKRRLSFPILRRSNLQWDRID